MFKLSTEEETAIGRGPQCAIHLDSDGVSRKHAKISTAGAMAATEFSLGGFIKLNMFWDSTQQGYTPTGVILRNNDALFHHGNFNMSAQESRFNFTIKGPKLWGATTTGFIEIDFDTLGDNNFSSVTGAVAQPAVTNPFVPRLRHAMFRLNWPETEVMLGQYWGLFSEFAPECTGDATFLFHGWTFQRVPQIRVTQKFAGNWTVAGIIAKPHDPAGADVNFTGSLPGGSFGTQLNTGLEGRSSEVPQLQGKLAYEADLYGKAAFYGRPRGFTMLELLVTLSVLAIVALAWATTPRALRAENEFGFAPIVEVAALFAGIFATMIPALAVLNAHGAALGIDARWEFFWATGLLSSFLDNAPTYLTFASVGSGVLGTDATDLGALLAHPEGPSVLLAVSAGALAYNARMPATELPPQRDLTRIVLTVLGIALLISASLWVLSPFLGAFLWATMIVVSTWPLMIAPLTLISLSFKKSSSALAGPEISLVQNAIAVGPWSKSSGTGNPARWSASSTSVFLTICKPLFMPRNWRRSRLNSETGSPR